VAQVASAQSAPTSVRLHIDSQPLPQALTALATQTGVQLVYHAEDISAGVISPAVSGSYTPDKALTKILDSSGLSFYHVNSNTIAIRTARADTASTNAGAGSIETGGDDRPNQGGATAPVRVAAADESTADSGGRKSAQTPLAEVVVTAEKREERLQDVPVPVTAISSDTLIQQNDLRLEDYYAKVPGLSLTTSDFGWPLLAIRGLTTGGYTNPTVAVTVDDVPYGSSSALANGEEVPDLDPSDLARVEVLRGPQGTLYGASSLGGLLKFVTVDPSTDRVFGNVQGGVSSVQNGAEAGYSFRGAVNLPISDTLAVRASGFARRDPGYVDNALTGQDGVNRLHADGGRLSALWRPSQDLTLKLSALVQHSDASGSPNVDVGTGLGDLQQSRVEGAGSNSKTLQAYSATLTAQLGAVQLTSVTGYNVETYHDSLDDSYYLGTYVQNGVPGTGFNGFGTAVSGALSDEHVKTERFTQELRLSGSLMEHLDWLIGGFYDHESSQYAQDILAAVPVSGTVVGTFAQIPTPLTFKEYAVFADLTYHFTDRFDVQFGGRESENRQSVTETISGPYDEAFLGVPSPVIYPKVDSSANAFTYLVTPRFKISPDLMVYARLASGYRPGGPNYNVGGVPLEYGPDKTENYEIGLKGEAFDRILSFDSSVYYIDWKNIQLDLENLTTGQTYYANGSRAKSQGVELSVDVRPLRGLTMSTWVTWNDAELTQDLPPASTVYGAAGDRLPYSSRFSGNFSVDEEFALTTDLTGFVGGSESYVGDREGIFTGLPGVPAPRQSFPAYAKTDLRAGLKYASWHWNLFVTNVADRRGVLGGGIGAVPPYSFIYIQPRLVGMSVEKTF
jgi:iron complex outermembrane recepter protein